MDWIYFTVNGEQHSLSGSEVSPDTSLNDYLRNYLMLHGTKAMCHEGGCGACIVSVSNIHPATKEKRLFSVNSCLVHILSCHQWDITTIEGVGNRKDGYHPIQSRLAAFNGTQCGYCTPGWVMNMYSLTEAKSQKLTSKSIENSFASNMCRCTGYRPILDAFKSFATDFEETSKCKIKDLEDLDKPNCRGACSRRKCSIVDEEWAVIDQEDKSLKTLQLTNTRWYKAFTVQDVFTILFREGAKSYRLIAGNTGQGVYSAEDARVLIDISSIDSLREAIADANLILGAGMTLNEMMEQFTMWSKKSDDFKYLEEFRKHLDLVAHIPVRNVGTIGGNLAMKNAHHDFPSDIFAILQTVRATVTIVNSSLQKSEVHMEDFLKVDLNNKMILNVKLPPLNSSYYVKTYKIMPRAQNAHAIVNAGFCLKLDSKHQVVDSTIVFGGINANFVRARKTENFLKNKVLFTDETIQRALGKLSDEIVPAEVLPDPSPFCRKTIALGLFYKAMLSLNPTVNSRYKSGGESLVRGISSGTQMFDTDKTLWPLNKPIPKLEALTQCSGEVKYSCDQNYSPRQVHLALVLSTICKGEIEDIDASAALELPGVKAFISAKNIPGKNTFTPLDVPWQEIEEEIFASKKVSFFGQPIGVIAARTHKLALKAAELVKVKYTKDASPVIVDLKDALNAPDKDKRIREEASIDATNKGTDTTHVIKGTFGIPSQYHYTMETQSCFVTNTDQGVRVYSASQWMDLIHVAVAHALDLPENRVEVVIERVGGGYGGKASRAAQVASAAALAARALGADAGLVLPLTHNMLAVGKRHACYAEYEVGTNNDGVIQFLNLKTYSDAGSNYNDSPVDSITSTLTGLYESSQFNIKGYNVITDTPGNTWCRAPGTTEGIAIMEHIMDHISFVTKKDATDVRIANLAEVNKSIIDIITTLKNDSNYNERLAEISKFNTENAWKKRVMKLCLMSYPLGFSYNYPVTISVYHADGTVAITHGGIEMGQGINTKVAQVCAYTLKIPLEKVVVKGTNSIICPNAMASNGSITSDSVAYATIKACKDLLERLQDVKNELDEPTWEEIISKAYDKGINLQANYMSSPLDSPKDYNVYGAGVSEIELDVLTGNHIVKRVDLLEDTGVSMSPDIDVGQIEGAFVMGLGLWTSEHLVFDKSSGQLLTDRTWTYKPPGIKDIPVDFRISFQRNSVNTGGVLRSKATGEPALTLAVSIPLAIREAIMLARKEFGYKDQDLIHVESPFTVENILTSLSPKKEKFKI